MLIFDRPMADPASLEYLRPSQSGMFGNSSTVSRKGFFRPPLVRFLRLAPNAVRIPMRYQRHEEPAAVTADARVRHN